MRFLLAILPLLSPLAHGQMNKAESTLFVRTVDDHLEAAIEIEIDSGWHLYHKDLGDDPNAVGKPTVVDFLIDGEESDAIQWSEVWFPEPHVGIQKGAGKGGTDAEILEHKGRIYLYAVGRYEESIDLDSLTVEINGLTCVDDGMCIPYGEVLEVDGEGRAKHWKQFPSELLSAEAAVDESYSGHTRGKLFVRHGVDETRAVIELEIDETWHIYHEDKGDGGGFGEETVITLAGENLTWGVLHWPKPYVHTQEGLGPKDPETGDFTDAWILAHEGKVIIKTSAIRPEGANPGDVTLKLVAQACDPMLCVPVELELTSSGKGPDEYFAEPFPPYVDQNSRATAEVEGGEKEGGDLSLWEFLALAFGAGLFTLLMPCTYPMIPITISFFTKQAEARNGNVLPLSLVYGAGITLIFVLIGVVLGPPIVSFASHGITNLIIGVMFVFFAMTLFGIIDLQPPAFLMNAAGKASMKGGYLGVFLMGATLVVTSFTCTAPFVGTLLTAGASAEDADVVRVALGMGVFGLTMAIPFVLLSLLPGKVNQMPKSGMWMKTLKVTLGFVELAAALKFLSNFEIYYHWNIFPKEAFLGLWILIFVIAALYLFGVFEKGKKPSAGRSIAAIFFLALAGYWSAGLFKVVEFDETTTAFLPPYGLEDKAVHYIADDYPGALARAKAENKLLFVNFTGFT